jgi:predicted Zn-dependent protease
MLFAAVVGCQGPRASVARVAEVFDRADQLRLQRLVEASRRLEIEEFDVGLSRRGEFGAWAWPGGPIQVSRSLVDLLDDDELAAAMAHELGHLQDAHSGGRSVSLDGGADLDVESRADAFGCRLLVLRGIDAAASARLLEKLSVVLGSPSAPSPFAARAERARAACRAS